MLIGIKTNSYIEREIDDHKMKLAIKIRFNANMDSIPKTAGK